MFTFLETEFEIWACFGPVGSTKNCQLASFLCFLGQKYYSMRIKKLQSSDVKKKPYFFFKI